MRPEGYFRGCLICSDPATLKEFQSRFISAGKAALLSDGEVVGSRLFELRSQHSDKLLYEFWQTDSPGKLSSSTLFPSTHLYILIDINALDDESALRRQIKTIKLQDSHALIILATRPIGLKNLPIGMTIAKELNCIGYFEYDDGPGCFRNLFNMIDTVLYERVIKQNRRFPNRVQKALLEIRNIPTFTNTEVDFNEINSVQLAWKEERFPTAQNILQRIGELTWDEFPLKHEDTIQLLHDSNKPIDIKDKRGETFLDFLVSRRMLELAKRLIFLGAKLHESFAHVEDRAELKEVAEEYRRDLIAQYPHAHEWNTQDNDMRRANLSRDLKQITDIDVYKIYVDELKLQLSARQYQEFSSELEALLDRIKYPCELIAFNEVGRLVKNNTLTRNSSVFSGISQLISDLTEFAKKIMIKEPTVANKLNGLSEAYQDYLAALCSIRNETDFMIFPQAPVFVRSVLFNGPRLLKPSLAANLASPFRENKTGNSNVKNWDRLYIKKEPELSSIERMVYQLHVAMGSKYCTPSTILVMHCSSNLEMNGCYLASYKVAAQTLQEHLEDHLAEPLNITPYNLAFQVVMTLLTRPSDAKPDNLMSSHPQGGGVDEIISIDNDHSLGDPIVVSEDRKAHQPGIKSIFLTLPEMNQVIDTGFRGYFLQLSIEHVMLDWLISLQESNVAYTQLKADVLGHVNHHQAKQDLERTFREKMVIARLKVGSVRELYANLQLIRAMMFKKKELTLNELFQCLYPLVFDYYERTRALAQGQDPDIISDFSYKHPLTSYFYTHIFSPDEDAGNYSFESLFQDIDTEKLAKFKFTQRESLDYRWGDWDQPIAQGIEEFLQQVDFGIFGAPEQVVKFFRKFRASGIERVHIQNCNFLGSYQHLRLTDLYSYFPEMNVLVLRNISSITFKYLQEFVTYDARHLARPMHLIIDESVLGEINIASFQELSRYHVTFSLIIDNHEFDLRKTGDDKYQLLQDAVKNGAYHDLLYNLLIDESNKFNIVYYAKAHQNSKHMSAQLAKYLNNNYDPKMATLLYQQADHADTGSDSELYEDPEFDLAPSPIDLKDYVSYAVAEMNCYPKNVPFLKFVFDQNSEKRTTEIIHITDSQYGLSHSAQFLIDKSRYENLRDLFNNHAWMFIYKKLLDYLRAAIATATFQLDFKHFVKNILPEAYESTANVLRVLGYSDFYPLVADNTVEQKTLDDLIDHFTVLFAESVDNRIERFVESLGSSQEDTERAAKSSIKAGAPLLHGRSDRIYAFSENRVIGNGDCGFITIGASRSQVASCLRERIQDLEFRKRLKVEIQEAFVYGHVQDLEELRLRTNHNEQQGLLDDVFRQLRVDATWQPQSPQQQQADRIASFIAWLTSQNRRDEATVLARQLEEFEAAERDLGNYYERFETVSVYLDALENRLWLGCQSALLYAEMRQISLFIWRENTESFQPNALSLVASHQATGPQVIHMLYTDGFTHFNLLVQRDDIPPAIAQLYPESPTVEVMLDKSSTYDRVKFITYILQLIPKREAKHNSLMNQVSALYFSRHVLEVLEKGPEVFMRLPIHKRLYLLNSVCSINTLVSEPDLTACVIKSGDKVIDEVGFGHYAVYYGQLQMAHWLINNGLKNATHLFNGEGGLLKPWRNIWNVRQKDSGRLPIEDYLLLGDQIADLQLNRTGLQMVKLLLEQGALMNFHGTAEKMPYMLPIPRSQHPESAEKMTHLYLFRLAFDGDYETFKLALRQGADPFYCGESKVARQSLAQLYKDDPERCSILVIAMFDEYLERWSKTFGFFIRQAYESSVINEAQCGHDIEAILQEIIEKIRVYMIGENPAGANQVSGLIGWLLERQQESWLVRVFLDVFTGRVQLKNNRLIVSEGMLRELSEHMRKADHYGAFECLGKYLTFIETRLDLGRSRLHRQVSNTLERYNRSMSSSTTPKETYLAVVNERRRDEDTHLSHVSQQMQSTITEINVQSRYMKEMNRQLNDNKRSQDTLRADFQAAHATLQTDLAKKDKKLDALQAELAESRKESSNQIAALTQMMQQLMAQMSTQQTQPAQQQASGMLPSSVSVGSNPASTFGGTGGGETASVQQAAAAASVAEEGVEEQEDCAAVASIP